jgi:16S rRNA (cytosine967-C5)-methyltransferase
MSSPVLNQAARVLRLVQTGVPADQALRESLTQDRHFTAPVARRAVSRAVFAYFRWWRWLEPKDSLQKQLEAAATLQARFEKNPSSFKPEALAVRAVPDWLQEEIPWPESPEPATNASVPAVDLNGPPTADPPPSNSGATRGKRPDPTEAAWLRQLQREPVLWIRIKQGLEAGVAGALKQVEPAILPAYSLKLGAYRYSGPTDLYRTPAFQSGEFEIQDLASQLVGHACAPRPGETWWDACAGEGGKTLHLSDLMQGKGMIWASDRSVRRLTKLKERASRAGVFNYRAADWDGSARLPTKTKFDGVLVDAPCSGVGTWQRNPHARWTTSPEDVRELAAVQARLLNHAAGSLKPGGRLVYSVCTLTRSETTAISDAFTATHPDLEPFQLSSLNIQRSTVFLWPHDLNANGMFIAAWQRK